MNHLCARRCIYVLAATFILCAIGSAESYAQPTNVEASDGKYGDRVVITWEAIPGAGTYVIQRSSASQSWKTISESGESGSGMESFTDDGVTPCVIYEYRIRVYDSTQWSTPDEGYAKGEPPDDSLLVQATKDQVGEITVSWSKVMDADDYTVYCSDAEAGPYVPVHKGITQSHWHDSTVTPCEGYWYRIAACSVCGCGDPSKPVSGMAGGVALPAPVRVSPASASIWYQCAVDVEWGPVGGAQYYRVEIWDSASVLLATYQTTATAFSVPQPAESDSCEGPRTLKVFACNCTAESLPLTWSFTWGGTDLLAPTTLGATQTVSQENSPAVALAWDPVRGATKYEVCFGYTAPKMEVDPLYPWLQYLAPGSSPVVVADPFYVLETGFDCAVSAWVRACTECGAPYNCGPFAAVQSHVPPPTAVVQNVQVSPTFSPTTIKLHWDSVAGAQGYRIDRTGGGKSVTWVVWHRACEYYDNLLSPCQTYSYTVSACAGCRENCNPLPSAPAIATIAAGEMPTLSLAVSYDGMVHAANLTWALVPGEQVYEIHRQILIGSQYMSDPLYFSSYDKWGHPYVYVPGAMASFHDVELGSCSATYRYRVQAYTSCGVRRSEWVDLVTMLDTPTGVAASIDPSGTKLVVSWNADANVGEYEVRANASGGLKSFVAATPPLEISKYEFPPGGWFVEIRVRSRNACYVSDWSDPVVRFVP